MLGWAGMRGSVSLAAALAIPLRTDSGGAFPERDLIIFLAFAVILVTLVGQGLTLGPLINGLGIEDDGTGGAGRTRSRGGGSPRPRSRGSTSSASPTGSAPRASAAPASSSTTGRGASARSRTARTRTSRSAPMHGGG